MRLLPLALLLVSTPALADDHRTAAPYFQIDSDSPGVDRLPLKETTADVDIAGVIAKVSVKQVYENQGSRPIEAVYVFPGGTRSAVFGMQMTIGERKIVAKIHEKQQARRIYERAKQEGRSASLLEQHRPNVFQMRVGNIMPGDRIVVELRYTELLVPRDGEYELVFPTVVGPRYADGTSGTDERWTQNPYLESSQASYRWDLSASIDAGMPIEAVSSPSHRVSPRFSGADRVGIEVDDEKGGNRDFVLRYRLSGRDIQTGLITFEGEKENFFLMMMQPPKRPAANAIPPREYIFVIDVSGSMRGFPLSVSKDLMRDLLGGMKSQDRFNVLLFAGGQTVMSEQSVPATDANVRRAMNVIDRERGGGGTRLLPALERALAMPRNEEMSTTIVVLTDGYVSVEKKTFDLIRQNLDKANLFAFGIGKSVNRHLIEGMARSGMGEPFVVMSRAEGKSTARRFARHVESPVLTGVGVQFDGFDAYDVEPSTLPDVFSQRPVIMFGKYRGRTDGRIVVEGRNGAGRFSRSIAVSDAKAHEDNLALRYLWARHRIASLADVGQLRRHKASVKREVTKLGLEYGLMTEHTSFVAVDTQVRNHDGAMTTVTQPLPTPDGVLRSADLAKAGPAPRLRRPRPMKKAMGRSRHADFGASLGGEVVVAEEAEKAPPAADPAPVQMAPGDSADDDRSGQTESKRDKSVRVQFSGANSAVQHLLEKRSSAFGRCLDQPSATLKLRLEIDASGKVRGITILKSSGSARSDACVSGLLRRMRFGASYRLELTIRVAR